MFAHKVIRETRLQHRMCSSSSTTKEKLPTWAPAPPPSHLQASSGPAAMMDPFSSKRLSPCVTELCDSYSPTSPLDRLFIFMGLKQDTAHTVLLSSSLSFVSKPIHICFETHHVEPKKRKKRSFAKRRRCNAVFENMENSTHTSSISLSPAKRPITSPNSQRSLFHSLFFSF